MANIDKSLYQAPAGLDELAQAEDAIEIEIVDPEEVNIRMGELEISIAEAEDEDLRNILNIISSKGIAPNGGSVFNSFNNFLSII